MCVVEWLVLLQEVKFYGTHIHSCVPILPISHCTAKSVSCKLHACMDGQEGHYVVEWFVLLQEVTLNKSIFVFQLYLSLIALPNQFHANCLLVWVAKRVITVEWLVLLQDIRSLI